MDLHPMYSHNIYTHFVYSFLRHHNTSGECATVAVHTHVIQRNVLHNHLPECVVFEETFASCSVCGSLRNGHFSWDSLKSTLEISYRQKLHTLQQAYLRLSFHCANWRLVNNSVDNTNHMECDFFVQIHFFFLQKTPQKLQQQHMMKTIPLLSTHLCVVCIQGFLS